ncbi:OmpH family outer membrane protein [Pseudodesulfovibrio sp. JC047]|uniref:OmpH family outer membrane protein n=1 Tax=Pseudodesulfovibrio sp. JC047 TaxID=2683199 RepID=UPI0013D15D8D|nr:OmpH family outer membrane protein [Pseudodesulfovibrio sp. JC047]NDV18098.1 OmpH family outer membrane protein [Pseudodesulfovibrio sp. JC047]
MKRMSTLLVAALLCLGLVACNQQQAPVNKIGIVDEAAAFKDNKVAQGAMDYLKEVGTPLQTKAEAAYKAMQENQTEDTVAAYKLAMGELQSVMGAEQQRVVGLVEAEFSKALEAYRAEKGLDVILSKQSVIAASDAIDITNDIVVAMDGMTVDFSKPEAPAAPEKVQTEEAAPEAPKAEESAAEKTAE